MSGKFCLNHELGEIVVSVKMPITRNGTKRPREPLLQLSIVTGCVMCRIVRRLRDGGASRRGAVVEILTFAHLVPNPLISGDIAWRVV